MNGKRWLAVYVLCAGVLMIVLDTTIVNIAEVTALMGFKDVQSPTSAHGPGRRREGVP